MTISGFILLVGAIVLIVDRHPIIGAACLIVLLSR
jgi:hypothetical protein